MRIRASAMKRQRHDHRGVGGEGLSGAGRARQLRRDGGDRDERGADLRPGRGHRDEVRHGERLAHRRARGQPHRRAQHARFQESEGRLESREAFTATWRNFVTRLLLALTFVLLVVLLPIAYALVASADWGLSLLTALTWAVARERKIGFATELVKHCAAALAVIAASRGIGAFITARLP